MRDGAERPVLWARGLRKEYGTGEGLVRAVDGVTSMSPRARRWR